MSHELEIILRAIQEASKIHRKYFQDPNLTHTPKGLSDSVSQADLESEKIILDILTKEFPDYSFFSEESGLSENKSNNQWIIDPMDGSSNFKLGLTEIGITIALLSEGQIIAGAVAAPLLNILAYAETGGGTYLNGTKITPDSTPQSNIISLIAGYAAVESQTKVWTGLQGKVKRILMQWAPTIDSLLLLSGKTDALISLDNEIEDQAAALLLFKEAGFTTRTLDNKDYDLNEFSLLLPKMVISRNEDISNRLIAEVNQSLQ